MAAWGLTAALDRAAADPTGWKLRWTGRGDAWVQAHYATTSREALPAWFPHRTSMALRKQAAALGPKRRHQGVPKPEGGSDGKRSRLSSCGRMSQGS
jgi:hypothetical protein